MDKKEIMSNMPSSNRGRKKLVNSLRGETFNDAYPNEGKTDAQQDASPSTETRETVVKETTEKTKEPLPKVEEKHTSDESRPTATHKKPSSTAKKKKKASTSVDSPREFTSFNCLKTTHTRTTVVSALLKKPIYELLDEAISEYISRLKKSGQITVDI